MFNKILELFDIQIVADTFARDNVVYREVLKVFINEHPELLETVHKNLACVLDSIEAILGPLANATDFQPAHSREVKHDASDVNKSSDQDMRSDDHDRLAYLYGMVRNYCSIIRSSSKKIDGFLELDISATIERLAYLRRAVITGGAQVYAQRLRQDYQQNKHSIEAFDLELQHPTSEHADKSQPADEPKQSDVIDKLNRSDYMSRFARVDDLNY